MVVVLGDVDKRGQALAEPHGDLPVHVDGEGLEALLEPAHGVVFEGAGVFAQVHAPHLGQAKAADGNKPCSPVGGGREAEGGENITPLRKPAAGGRNPFEFFAKRQFATDTLNKGDFIPGRGALILSQRPPSCGVQIYAFFSLRVKAVF